MKKKLLILVIILILVCSLSFLLFNKEKYYGVFLDSNDLTKISKYEVVVIDGQNYNSEDIDLLHESGCIVYSYINVGSLENYRDYYDDYKDLSLGTYQNWEDEVWINVTEERWITFIGDLARVLLDKGIDGLFIDNLDVYYNYNNEDIYNGLVTILSSLSKLTNNIIINGGDSFITKYINENGSINNLISGVNQECVFTSIDFSNNKFNKASKESKEYFLDYLDMCKKDGLDIYLLEYTNNPLLVKQIDRYCINNNYHYYISDSLDLD